MHRPAVEFPLFCGDEKEDVREFLGNNDKRAGLLNGWEKLDLVFPSFTKKKHTQAYGLRLCQVQKI